MVADSKTPYGQISEEEAEELMREHFEEVGYDEEVDWREFPEPEDDYEDEDSEYWPEKEDDDEAGV
jgi:hypothetical protein